jgi:hypothetical protein
MAREIAGIIIDDGNNDQKAYSEALALRAKAIQGKKEMRKRLAALSFDQKIKILEKLRDSRTCHRGSRAA